jgi:cytochrome c peroxidase
MKPARQERGTQGIRFRLLALIALIVLIFSAFSFHREKYLITEPYEIRYPSNFGGRFTIPADNPMTKEGVALGRMLFYEERLSVNDKVSCATCHKQERAFTDGMPFSTGVDGTGTKRNSMSLSNLLWVKNLFWDGRSTSLEEQSIVPLTDPHEMGQSLEASSKKLSETKHYPQLFEKAFGTREINGTKIGKALAQFERILISANSKYDQYLRGDYKPTESELRGLKLFSSGPQPDKNIRGANCIHCHSVPKTFLELFHNNGLDSIQRDFGREDFTKLVEDRGRFRVPTLRNIAVTAPYMHDGRFWTLNEVIDHYSDHVKSSGTLSPFIAGVTNKPGSISLALTKEEKQDILSFLHMLTDNTFITNPEFSDPEQSTPK